MYSDVSNGRLIYIISTINVESQFEFMKWTRNGVEWFRLNLTNDPQPCQQNHVNFMLILCFLETSRFYASGFV